MTEIENAIKCLQSAFEVVGKKLGYDSRTNTFAGTDETLLQVSVHLHETWGQLAQAIGLDLSRRPDLALNRAFELRTSL